MTSVRQFVLLLAIAFSFGGFSFYAAVVVPIGSDVFDATSQGFVTQRVTHVINYASFVTGVMLLWEGLAARRNKHFFALLAIYSVCLIALFAMHPQLDELLNFDDQSVIDSVKFYNLHRIYLWTSTIQWLATIGMIWLVFAKRPDLIQT